MDLYMVKGLKGVLRGVPGNALEASSCTCVALVSGNNRVSTW
jgi:hypothetical protein